MSRPRSRCGSIRALDSQLWSRGAFRCEGKSDVLKCFKSNAHDECFWSRIPQLTQKAKTMQFKTLDSALQTMNKETNQRQTITYRCVDMDRMVPSLMGVSKAVLENVIFVHQEDSNWPLSEGKVLKDKFDDIFAATKYTKVWLYE